VVAVSGGAPRARFWNRWRLGAWCGAAAFILAPLIAMHFTSEVNWGLEDFAFAVGMVVAAGGTYEFAARTTASRAYKLALGIALGATFVLLWGNAAVGVIGSESNAINRVFDAVPVVGWAGAILARFRPMGMARAMTAAAAAQVLAFVIALVGGYGFTGPITVLFAAMWLTSAWLFAKASRP